MLGNESYANDRKKKLLFEKQMKDIEKQELQILNQRENAFIRTKIAPVMDKIQEKIPEKLKSVLDAAFYKGFQLVFDKGNIYIEKTYNKDKIQLEHDLNNYAIDKYQSKRHMKRMDRQTMLSTSVNSSVAVLEGGVLGILGIGLPDIPLFISVIIRTLNEIALTYGYNYDTEDEKTYLLYIISGALSKGEKQRKYNQKIDILGANIDSNIVTDMILEEKIRETSDLLSDALLTAKFIQGIPFVGVIGGVVNHSIMNKVAKYARVKYKKRYLLRKIKESN